MSCITILSTILSFIIILHSAAYTYATIYSCKNSKGTILFQNFPCNNVEVKTKPKRTQINSQELISSPNNNESIADIPLNAFRATYFDNKGKKLTKQTEVVEYPALFKGFKSGSWVGYFEYPKNTVKQIDIYQGNGRSELIIDNQTVWKGNGYSKSTPYTFTAGRHKIEVNYSRPNSRSASFLTSINDPFQYLKSAELTKFLKKLNPAESYYCGVYESNSTDGRIELSFQDTGKPTIFFLSSFEGVVWDFLKSNTKNLSAVVVSSRSYGGTLKNLPSHIPVYHFKEMAYLYDFIQKDTRDYKTTFKYGALQIQSLTGKKPVGFSGSEKASALAVPQLILTEKKYQEIGLQSSPTNMDIFKLYPDRIDIVFEPESLDTTGGDEILRNRPSWGSALNSTNEIPKTSFKAFYLDMFQPGIPAFTGVVKDIAIYGNGPEQLNGINPQHFAGYWIGQITAKANKKMRLNIAQGNSTTRVLIDNEVVYAGEGDPNAIIEFTKGAHIIEVEHVNDWHTVGFSLSLSDNSPILPYEEVRARLKKILPAATHTIYAGVNSSKNKDNSITLDVQNIGKPIFLILNSSDPVRWIIDGPGKKDIKAVLLSSSKSQSKIEGDLESDVNIIPYQWFKIVYNLLPECRCYSPPQVFRCEGENFLDTIDDLELITGQKTVSFTGEYSADRMVVPEIILNQAQLKKLQLDKERVTLKKQQCESSSTKESLSAIFKVPAPEMQKLQNLEVVQTAIESFRHLQANEFAEYTQLLHPRLVERSEDQLKEHFIRLHNGMAGFDIVLDFDKLDSKNVTQPNRRRQRLHFLLIKKGRPGLNYEMDLEKTQNGWKVVRM